MGDAWSLAQVWNVALENVPRRELEPRDYVWASELGGSFYDRYWKMKGRKPTTPPNVRALRKFEAGNLIEWVILQVLARAGVLDTTQDHFSYEDGAIKVTGRLDFKAGGEIRDASFDDFPDTMQGIAESTLAKLKEKYPDGMADINIEVKSCAGTMFERYQLAPAPQHGLQAFVQAKSTNRPTLLVYVSRDDLRICEWKIMPGSEKWQKLLDKDLDKMNAVMYLLESDMEKGMLVRGEPVKEPLLQYVAGKFSSNWKITYSNYLTDYGFKFPEEYDKPAKSIALRLNNIIKRIKAGKEMSKVNLATLEECYKFYPEAEGIINKLQGEK